MYKTIIITPEGIKHEFNTVKEAWFFLWMTSTELCKIKKWMETCVYKWHEIQSYAVKKEKTIQDPYERIRARREALWISFPAPTLKH